MNPMSKNMNDNVEQLKRIAKEQRAEIFRLKNVIDHLPGSIYWKDKNGYYLGRNTYSLEKMQSVNLENNARKDDIVGKTDYESFSQRSCRPVS